MATPTRSIKAKVVVVGATGVGKTSIILRRDGQGFSSRVSPTIGASFITSSVMTTVDSEQSSSTIVELQIWDTAGQERFRSMVPMYLRNASAVLMVYDITSRASFDELVWWHRELESAATRPLILSVLANKTDLMSRCAVPIEDGKKFAIQHSATFYETSALIGSGIEHVFHDIAMHISRQHNNTTSGITDSLTLSARDDGVPRLPTAKRFLCC